VATRFFKAWTTGDFDTTRLLLHDDVSFRGPIDSFTDAGYYLILLARLTKDLLRLTFLSQPLGSGSAPAGGSEQARVGRLRARSDPAKVIGLAHRSGG
jgi:hypothetical protein